MTTHDLLTATDPDGRAVVGVALSNRPQRVWLYAADYERIMDRYGAPNWTLTGNGDGSLYVRFTRPGGKGRKVTVAREVAGDWERTGVRCRDADPLNLRRSNLYHVDGGGGRPKRTASMFATSRPQATGRTC